MLLRRRTILSSGFLLGIYALLQQSIAEAYEHEIVAPNQICMPNDPLERLINGNLRFAHAWSTINSEDSLVNRQRTMSSLWKKNCFYDPDVLSKDQHPWATIFTCSDSRISPDWIFDTTPGEIFVIQTAGNTFGKESIGSIEYSVVELNSPLLLIMGHSDCGAVKSAISNTNNTTNINSIVNNVKKNILGSANLIEAIENNAKETTNSILKKSSIIRERFQNKTLEVKSSYFDIKSGTVRFL